MIDKALGSFLKLISVVYDQSPCLEQIVCKIGKFEGIVLQWIENVL